MLFVLPVSPGDNLVWFVAESVGILFRMESGRRLCCASCVPTKQVICPNASVVVLCMELTPSVSLSWNSVRKSTIGLCKNSLYAERGRESNGVLSIVINAMIQAVFECGPPLLAAASSGVVRKCSRWSSKGTQSGISSGASFLPTARSSSA